MFAHLLLAKVHGGRMWRPLMLMLRPARQLGFEGRGKRARRIAAHAKLAFIADQTGRARPDVSAALKGRPKSDVARARMSAAALGKTITAATRAKMAAASTGRAWSRASRDQLAAKRMGDANPAKRAEVRAKIAAAASLRTGAANSRFDHTIREFRHDDGTVERLTKFDMCAKHGLNRTCLNYVISGQRYSTKGWRINDAIRASAGVHQSVLPHT
jgi:hypothetical protein